MKKIIWILPFFLLLMGCSAEYTITFEKEEISDETFIYDTKEAFKEKTSTDKGIEEVSDALFSFESYQNDKPIHKFIQREKNVGYKYQSSISLQDHERFHPLVGQCYDDISIEKDPNTKTIHFKSSARFTCFNTYPELTDVTIRFKTSYKVEIHNADKVEGNTYIWNIQKGTDIKPIYISVQYDNVIKEETKEKVNFPFLPVILVIGSGILIYILVKKHKQNDTF